MSQRLRVRTQCGGRHARVMQFIHLNVLTHSQVLHDAMRVIRRGGGPSPGVRMLLSINGIQFAGICITSALRIAESPQFTALNVTGDT